MPSFRMIKETDDTYHIRTYNRIPILLVEGKGSRVRDSCGREFIDMVAGIAVNSLGHCHPAVVQTIQQQAQTLIHCSNLYYIEPQAKLAKLLIDHSDMDRIFFGNSGTEAVEGAMKLARKYGWNNKRGGGIITMEGSFHGRSLAAVTATGQRKYRTGFDPLPPGFSAVAFNDLTAVSEAISNDTCAIMVEPVQGEGGIRIAKHEYLQGLRELCDDHNILLIFDEIQCGMGRIGTLYAYQRFDVIPDIITLAKGLGGGFPIGAFLAKEHVAQMFEPGDHGTTFGGNPLATATAYNVVRTIIDEALPERSQRAGAHVMEMLKERTRHIPFVREIRGMGLMIGVELDRNGKDIVNALMDRGILANCTADTVIRFVPPLNIPMEDLNVVVDTFIEILEEVRHDG